MIYTTLTLNGRTYVGPELRSLCVSIVEDPRTESWEREIYSFILDWVEPSDTISVSTSGSTGQPRVFQAAKERMVQSALVSGKTFDLKPGETALLCLPVVYIAGKMMIVRAFVCGLNLVYTKPQSNPLDKLCSDADFAAVVPLQLERAIESGTVGRVRTLIVGGAPVSEGLKRRARQEPARIIETYSLTETLSHVAIRPLNGPGASRLFQALESVRFELDGRGCLVINAPRVNPEPVVTNDLVKLHDSQSFEWLGRIDNVINTGGVKVVPEQVEKRLKEFIPDRRFCVTGKADERLGEKLILIIEGEPRALDENGLSREFNPYEIPKEILFFPSFDETKSGKVNRLKLKARAEQVCHSRSSAHN